MNHVFNDLIQQPIRRTRILNPNILNHILIQQEEMHLQEAIRLSLE